MTRYLLLIPLNVVIAAVLAFVVNWIAARSWRKAAAEHWTERARQAWPLRKAAKSNVFVLPLCLLVVEAGMPPHEAPLGLMALGLAGLVGAILGAYPLEKEINPRFTFCGWLRLAGMTWIVFLGFLSILAACIVAMPETLGAMTAVIAIGFLGFMIALNLGLYLRVLRLIGMLREPGERLWSVVSSTARRMGVPEPPTWLLDVPLSYAAAFPTTGELIFSGRLVEVMPDDEISAICAHEIGHLTESKAVLATRVAGSFTLYPLIFLRPAWRFGLWSIVAFLAWVVLAIVLTRKLSRRMEKRADKIAVENQGEAGVYARALERLYRDNLMPAVMPNNRLPHPNLYDRMLAAGIAPEYPRPAKPEDQIWLNLVFWLVLGVAIGRVLALRER